MIKIRTSPIKDINDHFIKKSYRYLKKINFIRTRENLDIIDLNLADLSEIIFYKANLKETNLTEVKLYRAKLFYSNLLGAMMTGSDLNGARVITMKKFPQIDLIQQKKIDKILTSIIHSIRELIKF